MMWTYTEHTYWLIVKKKKKEVGDTFRNRYLIFDNYSLDGILIFFIIFFLFYYR